MVGLSNLEDSSFLTIRRLADEGKLTPAQAALYGPRAAEELYDLENDPDEVVNLAADPAYGTVLNEMREALAVWIEDTDDKGQYPRSQAGGLCRSPCRWGLQRRCGPQHPGPAAPTCTAGADSHTGGSVSSP